MTEQLVRAIDEMNDQALLRQGGRVPKSLRRTAVTTPQRMDGVAAVVSRDACVYIVASLPLVRHGGPRILPPCGTTEPEGQCFSVADNCLVRASPPQQSQPRGGLPSRNRQRLWTAAPMRRFLRAWINSLRNICAT